METIKCIETRRSIRKFKAQQIPHELMQEIISAADMRRHGKTHRLQDML